MGRWTRVRAGSFGHLLLVLIQATMLAAPAGGAGPVFSFAAAGDHGRTEDTAASLARLGRSGAGFYLALGDLGYGSSGAEKSWCDFVYGALGKETYPFQVIAGNHEDDERRDGWIGEFARHCPDRIGVRGSGLGGTLPGYPNGYGAEYYFDYPASSPLVRVFMISPALTIGGKRYSYNRGNPRYNWLSGKIDEARSAGIPWVVVGMHRVCVSAGSKPCQAGADLMDLLIRKRVDLVLQGHDHTYQRSKQLRCARTDAYVRSCVADDGSDARYEKGAGTVFVIAGTFGNGLDSLGKDDPEAPYFARRMGARTPGAGYGFVEYAVSADRIEARTRFSGAFQDGFRIVAR